MVPNPKAFVSWTAVSPPKSKQKISRICITHRYPIVNHRNRSELSQIKPLKTPFIHPRHDTRMCYTPSMSEVTGISAGRTASRRVREKLGWLILVIAVWWPGVLLAQANSPAFNFFTNTADRVIRYTTAQWYAHDPVDYSNTFGGFTGGFSLTNIPVRINGQFVYTPAVNRLLQLSANLYEATTNTFYPAVYRPSFYVDANGNIFICGYNQILPPVAPGATPLDSPISITALHAGYSSGAETNSLMNVYGVPWIIGARKYLPNFNQFYLQNLVQITRKLQVDRTRMESYNNNTSGDFRTNQLFIMSITNRIGFSFWNSYQTNYPGGLPTVYAHDLCWMILTNNTGGVSLSVVTNVFYSTNLANPWPGATWNINLSPAYRTAASDSFFFSEGDFAFLGPAVYNVMSHTLTPIPSNGQIPFNTNDASLQNLDQFGLITSNWFQAYIVDNSNVVDYVQYIGPNSSQNLNNEMLDSLIGPNGSPYFDMWITNLNFRGVNYGLANQIYMSQEGTGYAPNSWRLSGLILPGMPDTVANEAEYFLSFFTGAFIGYNGQIYQNTNLTQIAPYTPTRIMANTTVWQANDPLVHYLVSDLNEASPFLGSVKSDDILSQPFPTVFQNKIGQSTFSFISDDHYQPWGVNFQLGLLPNVDTNAYDLAYRDPLVYRSDDWDFPTNFSPTPDWLGRIHRGTPWQTIYLKSTNILLYANGIGFPRGLGTWMDWSGDSNVNDAINSAPVNDHALLTPLLDLLNTNDIRTLISVNDPNPGDWLVTLDGLDVLTNTMAYPIWGDPSQLTFDDITLSSNSPVALALFNAIQAARHSMPGGDFTTIGDLLNTPQLAEQSPFLDTANTSETQYSISDEAYERIAAQLLFRVRADSFGSAISTSAGQATVQFSGTDGYSYAIQVSPDLLNWTTVSTNCPMNDVIQVSIPTTASRQFYRSVLLP